MHGEGGKRDYGGPVRVLQEMASRPLNQQGRLTQWNDAGRGDPDVCYFLLRKEFPWFPRRMFNSRGSREPTFEKQTSDAPT